MTEDEKRLRAIKIYEERIDEKLLVLKEIHGLPGIIAAWDHVRGWMELDEITRKEYCGEVTSNLITLIQTVRQLNSGKLSPDDVVLNMLGRE